MKTHARLLAYADTAKKLHPLVLVVGREASKDATLVDGVGNYDFDAVDSKFWTTAYSTISTVGGSDLKSLRIDCRQRQSSPIVFADALPIGINHSNESKLALRDEITTEALDTHLSALLQMPILDRVTMIVCAGHREGTRGSPTAEALFERAFETFRMHSNKHNITLAETPAMLGFNSPMIRDRLSGVASDSGSCSASILKEFKK